MVPERSSAGNTACLLDTTQPYYRNRPHGAVDGRVTIIEDIQVRLSQPAVVLATPAMQHPKSAMKHRCYLARLPIAPCHGVSTSHFEEFQAFRRSRWMGEFQQAGYEVISYSKGPWTTGYGFGCGALRPLLRRLFPACEHIFVLRRMPPSSAQLN